MDYVDLTVCCPQQCLKLSQKVVGPHGLNLKNHKHKIEEKSTKSSWSSSKVVGLGLADLWEFPTLVPRKAVKFNHSLTHSGKQAAFDHNHAEQMDLDSDYLTSISPAVNSSEVGRVNLLILVSKRILGITSIINGLPKWHVSQCCRKCKILAHPTDYLWLMVGWSVSVLGSPSINNLLRPCNQSKMVKMDQTGSAFW